MKILFVNNFRGRGGGEEFLRDLLPGLAAQGVQVGLVCKPGSPLYHMFSGSEVRVYPIDRSGFDGITSVFKIATIIRRGGYDAVNIQRRHDIFQSWIAAKLSRKRPALIYTVQVFDFVRSRFLLNRMDRIVTISRYIRDAIISFEPVLRSKLSVQYYGIDHTRFGSGKGDQQFLRRKFGFAPDVPVIGTVGDLWKNQIEFLDVLAGLKKIIPSVRYALVAAETGIGQIQQFKDRAAVLGVADSVLWAGRLNKEEMRDFYASIDIAVSTHRNEGFGIWVLEALAAGRPVVAFDGGGIRDSLENCPAGKLVGDGREMLATLTTLLADRKARDRVAAAGPQWVAEKFTVARMVNDYEAFFRELLYGEHPRGTDGLNILLMISKNDRYGAQRIFLDQVAILREMGNRVVVVGRGDEGYVTDSVTAMGVEYHGSRFAGLGALLELRRLVNHYSIDIIHTTLDRADNFGILLSLVTRKPVVCTNMVPRHHVGFRFADRVVVLSEMQKKLLTRKGVPPDKISLIRPGIDVQRFTHPSAEKMLMWREKLGIAAYSMVFCHVASIIPRKAHAVSLEIVAACKKMGERPLLIIIGDPLEGTCYDTLQASIAEQGLKDNVACTGWTADVPELMALSHFTLLPSELEALGMVLMEGMAAGTPVVAREHEGGAELIEEYGTGFLYRPAQGVDALASRMVALMKDTRRFSALELLCRETARREFTRERFGEKIMQLYRELSPTETHR